VRPMGVLQLLVFAGAVLLLVRPIGAYMARVYEGDAGPLQRVVGPLERLVYRACGVRPDDDMDWKRYAVAMLAFNAAGVFATYAIQRFQSALPLNPEALPGVRPDLAFDTAISFVTNTNWQAYAGETTMSYLTQMLALTVQNFVSAASGMAVAIALVRGFARRSASGVGNFWTDLVRGTLYVLLPLSVLLALLLLSQGVVQTLSPHRTVALLEPLDDAHGRSVATQVLAVGPAASQVAIKLLGTNGGGFFNVNSAHPFENPTPLACFFETVAIFVIPAGLCFTFGKMVRDPRQGFALLAAMSLVFVAMLAVCVSAEQAGNPRLGALGADLRASATAPGGNMDGKELRFGIPASALFATVTTSASCGAVDSMHDSFTPIGGLVPMWLIQLGEVVFGGVGAGLYGILAFAVVTVFVAGLMVGRTPEYLGKKIEAFEMKMASLAILVPPSLVLVGTALAVSTEAGRAGVANPGAHGFSEILYAFTSASNNNGSAFAGLSADTPFCDVSLALAMFFGRFFVKIPMLAIAGSLAAKKRVPASAGTLPTHGPLFVTMLVGVVAIVGALTFIPALALGPIVEQLQMLAR
jgi:K+-transporting ATPase ATPase A chain